MHRACMALCSCNLFEDWVFHWAAGCRALDLLATQPLHLSLAWNKMALYEHDHHPAPPFLPLTPTYRAVAWGAAHQVLPLVSFTAARGPAAFREQKLPQSNLTFTGTNPVFNQECSDISREPARGRPADREQHVIPQVRRALYNTSFPFCERVLKRQFKAQQTIIVCLMKASFCWS